MGETVELEISEPHSMMLEEIEASRTGVSDDLARQHEPSKDRFTPNLPMTLPWAEVQTAVESDTTKP